MFKFSARKCLVLGTIGLGLAVGGCRSPQGISSATLLDAESSGSCLASARVKGARLDAMAKQLARDLTTDSDPQTQAVYADLLRKLASDFTPKLARVMALASTEVPAETPAAAYLNLCHDMRVVATSQLNDAFYLIKNMVNATITHDMNANQAVPRALRVREYWNPQSSRDSLFKAYQGAGDGWAAFIDGLAAGPAPRVSFAAFPTPPVATSGLVGAARACGPELRVNVDRMWAMAAQLEADLAQDQDPATPSVYAEALSKVRGELRSDLARLYALSYMQAPATAAHAGFVNPCHDARLVVTSRLNDTFYLIKNSVNAAITHDVNANQNVPRALRVRNYWNPPTARDSLFKAYQSTPGLASFVTSLDVGIAPLVGFAP